MITKTKKKKNNEVGPLFDSTNCLYANLDNLNAPETLTLTLQAQNGGRVAIFYFGSSPVLAAPDR